MKLTNHLSLEEVINLHKDLIEKYGGDSGIRDFGLLESALARSKSGYYKTLSEQSAALLQSLILNHCFYDGNKRIAFAAMATFLWLNGYRIKVSAEEAESFLIDQIIIKKIELTEISNWVSDKIEKN